MAGKVGPVLATGHGFALPNEIGEAPLNIVFEGPTAGERQSVEEMVASTERGILVTRLWYIREVDPYEKILTGMTRDGTFLVEDGKMQCGIRNFRFNESLIHMLAECRSDGRTGALERRRIDGHGRACHEGAGLQFHGNHEVLSIIAKSCLSTLQLRLQHCCAGLPHRLKSSVKPFE